MNPNYKKIILIEAILYIVGDNGIDIAELTNVLNINLKLTLQLIYEYSLYLEHNNKPFELFIFNDRVKLVTKIEWYPYLINLVDYEKNKTLSRAALEVLAIVAYNNERNITRSEISRIRGVNCDSTVSALLVKEFLEYAGKDETLPGRPLILKVTNKFYDVFNISNTNELPKYYEFKEIKITDNLFANAEEKKEDAEKKSLKDILDSDDPNFESKSDTTKNKGENEINELDSSWIE